MVLDRRLRAPKLPKKKAERDIAHEAIEADNAKEDSVCISARTETSAVGQCWCSERTFSYQVVGWRRYDLSAYDCDCVGQLQNRTKNKYRK